MAGRAGLVATAVVPIDKAEHCDAALFLPVPRHQASVSSPGQARAMGANRARIHRHTGDPYPGRAIQLR